MSSTNPVFESLPVYSTNASINTGSPSRSRPTTPPPQEGRKIGTQERPLETAYYDLLGVPVDAITDDIKRAHRYLMIRLLRYVIHHDKNGRLDPNAEERLKSISIAYQTLSDPQLRHKYNEFGPKESAPEGGFVDPEEVFGLILGGQRFLPLIGPLFFRDSFSRHMKTAFQGADATEGDDVATPFQRDARDSQRGAKTRVQVVAAWNAARVQKLVENLCNKLGGFTENAASPTDPDVTESWRRTCALEAEELKGEFYGVELLNAIGSVYTAKAKQFEPESFGPVGGWLECVQHIYHMFSCIVSTRRLAKQRDAMLDQIQQGEVSGILSAEEKKRLEEQATEKGFQVLFEITKVEIKWVLGETCESVLNDPTISRHGTGVMRAAALQTLGDAFMAVRNE